MIREHPRGCVLRVHAQPGARKRGLAGSHGNAVKLAVSAPADKGRANAALADLLAELLAVSPSRVELISGAATRAKQFLILGLAPDAVRERLGLLRAAVRR